MNPLAAILKCDDGTHMDCHILNWWQPMDTTSNVKAIISSDVTGQLFDVHVSTLTLKNQPGSDNDDSFPIRRSGEVVKVEPLAGSFCKVTIQNKDKFNVYTCGFNADGEWPKLNDLIVLEVVRRHGRYLTQSWSKAL